MTVPHFMVGLFSINRHSELFPEVTVLKRYSGFAMPNERANQSPVVGIGFSK
jgi:hypothetical protein